MALSAEELTRIRKRADNAVVGPWYRLGPVTRSGFTFADNGIFSGEIEVVGWPGFDSADGTKKQKRANAVFIAHARHDIPLLLDTIDELRAALTRMARVP